MTEPTPSSLPTARVDTPRRFRIPLVWVIPLVAALIGVFLALHTWYQQGPDITIRFKTGEGLEAGKTRIKYKDVDVGQIDSVTLAEDGSYVIAGARLARSADHLLVDDTRFWMVSARVSGSAVSGLGTLLSGTYVGLDAGKSAEARREFTALDDAPVVSFDVPGRYFTLHAETLGSIGVGTPVYFRRMPAGQVTGYRLGEHGKRIEVRVFIKAPYDRFVTNDTRFWNAGGVDVKVGADGVQVNTESLTAILAGGLAFLTPADSPDEPAAAERSFRLFANREEAIRRQVDERQHYVLRFTESVRGLSVGAPVDFRGITIGEVVAIQPQLNLDSADISMHVEVSLQPGRLRTAGSKSRLPAGATSEDAAFRAFVDQLVAKGLRAQLRNGNLVTGQLYVALDFFPGAGAARPDWAASPPRLPTQRGSLDELQTTLMRIVGKLDKLPIEQIGTDTRKLLASLQRSVDETEALLKRIDNLTDGEVRSTIVEARSAIADTRKLIASDAPLQQDLRASLQELGRAAQALRHLADTLDRHPEALLRGKPEEKP
ncbi:paraquat-inducible protein [Zoogloea ramigera]|uniref:Paraquat-inducible protein n=1 Tax=Zoogloea ramigera TaxID=350 RepID=A0A4Y4CVF2_ZOORA|nr:MlaD family protein [Zoogloea ramigera]GEC96858.1 paraquat-inducible protein [Zoogloea ramigera]